MRQHITMAVVLGVYILGLMQDVVAVQYIGPGEYVLKEDDGIYLCNNLKIVLALARIVGNTIYLDFAVPDLENPPRTIASATIEIPLCDAQKIVLKDDNATIPLKNITEIKYIITNKSFDLNNFAHITIKQVFLEDAQEIRSGVYSLNRVVASITYPNKSNAKQLCEKFEGVPTAGTETRTTTEERAKQNTIAHILIGAGILLIAIGIWIKIAKRKKE